MDHIELAVLVAKHYEPDSTLHYDLRVRGGTLEKDIELAQERFTNVLTELDLLAKENEFITTKPTKAYFMLSGDGEEFGLESTVARELGFAAHHAIHHMAVIKMIAVGHLKIPVDSLPSDFGRAPSTVHHDARGTSH